MTLVATLWLWPLFGAGHIPLQLSCGLRPPTCRKTTPRESRSPAIRSKIVKSARLHCSSQQLAQAQGSVDEHSTFDEPKPFPARHSTSSSALADIVFQINRWMGF